MVKNHDPRFDPRFQRGYSPAADGSVPTAVDPPAPPPLQDPGPENTAESDARDATVPAPDHVSHTAPLSRTAQLARSALGAVAVVAVLVGVAWTYQSLTMPPRPGASIDFGDILFQSSRYVVGPALLAGAAIAAIGWASSGVLLPHTPGERLRRIGLIWGIGALSIVSAPLTQVAAAQASTDRRNLLVDIGITAPSNEQSNRVDLLRAAMDTYAAFLMPSLAVGFLAITVALLLHILTPRALESTDSR